MALPRLIFVTGKGGTGKSTLSAALAAALAGRGRRSLLASLDGRRSAARMLEPEEGGDPRKNTSPGGAPEILTLSRRAELEAFIERIVPLRAISNRMLKSRTFGYVTSAVPGLEAFLLMERLRAVAGDAALNDYYVVADAPASGNALEMLAVAAGVKGLAPRGTLNRLASGVEALITDPRRFGVALAATPADLAVREALATAGRLKELGIARVIVMLNCTVEALFETAEIEALRKLNGHHELAARRRELARRTDAARRKLRAAGLEAIELPMLFRAELHRRDLLSLARRLGDALLSDEAGA
ncbi:MAG TPA: ArsA-related P-loop ATPase [Candidatus Binataceae bacterium]|nr:ArsA-related P-loop ATPase [Candidatus Binataceae bacterium]